MDLWRKADANISTDRGAIFAFDATFDRDGNVAFVPDVNSLVTVVTKSLTAAIHSVNVLPRIFQCRDVADIFAAQKLSFHDAADFIEMINCIPVRSGCEERMMEVIQE
jgi:hypothetical protein